jgi:hypothetical protein
LTRAQRAVVAEIIPELAMRLRLDEPAQRTVRLTLDELKDIERRATDGVSTTTSGMKRHSLRHVADIAGRAVERYCGWCTIPVTVRVYQFKITLMGTSPLVWRRLRVKECTLDKLHEHIQTAMHLHHFRIEGQRYGDPELIDENYTDMGYDDSTITKLGHITVHRCMTVDG